MVSAMRARAAAGPSSSRRHAGFTMIELIVTMVIIGILAVSVVPRFADRATFTSRGFQDETLALLRYGQKAAIAQRRTVCVEFPDASSIQLRISSAANASACDTNLTGPNGTTPHRVTARTGTGHNRASGDNFLFYSSGRPSVASSFSIAITNAGTVTVEAETGYVH